MPENFTHKICFAVLKTSVLASQNIFVFYTAPSESLINQLPESGSSYTLETFVLSVQIFSHIADPIFFLY